MHFSVNAGQITVIVNEMKVWTSRFANADLNSQIKQIWVLLRP